MLSFPPGGNSKVLWHTLVSTIGAVHVWSWNEVMRATTVKCNRNIANPRETNFCHDPRRWGLQPSLSFLLSVKLEVKSHRSETAARGLLMYFWPRSYQIEEQ